MGWFDQEWCRIGCAEKDDLAGRLAFQALGPKFTEGFPRNMPLGRHRLGGPKAQPAATDGEPGSSPSRRARW
ncbi:protein of unknown function [Hyphomicrobium sp. MC1]|nr:protein of unknown function [Hyphomicrobium sp. MC1]